MTDRRIRWALALMAIAVELASFVAWRVWVGRHAPEAATGD